MSCIPGFIPNFILTAIIFMMTSITLAFSGKPAPVPIENLDLNRYQGLWHEIAAIPTDFQKDCYANASAEYTRLDNGHIKVFNSCDTKFNGKKSAEGRARINNEYKKSSTLEVTFVKLFKKWRWSLSGDYWVTYISKNYDIAIVGHPKLTTGWILSRDRVVDFRRIKKLEKELQNQGYNTCQFIMTRTPFYKGGVSLCEYVR